MLPHGITPPTKNIRRRRFRKTLKKKYVEAPEIEKEVKRLLRIDNEAVKVTWEVICEDEDQKPNVVSASGSIKPKRENTNSNNSQSVDVAEHDIFGEAVSDSEEEDEETHVNVMDMDDTSRVSGDLDLLSRISDSNSMITEVPYSEQSANPPVAPNNSALVTQFSREMFNPNQHMEDVKPTIVEEAIPKVEGDFDDYDMSQSFDTPGNKGTFGNFQSRKKSFG